MGILIYSWFYGESISFLTIKYDVSYTFFVDVLYQVEKVLFHSYFAKGFLFLFFFLSCIGVGFNKIPFLYLLILFFFL